MAAKNKSPTIIAKLAKKQVLAPTQKDKEEKTTIRNNYHS